MALALVPPNSVFFSAALRTTWLDCMSRAVFTE